MERKKIIMAKLRFTSKLIGRFQKQNKQELIYNQNYYKVLNDEGDLNNDSNSGKRSIIKKSKGHFFYNCIRSKI